MRSPLARGLAEAAETVTLGSVVAADANVGDWRESELVVRIMPADEASAERRPVLPVTVVGHATLSEGEWRRIVRAALAVAYGADVYDTRGEEAKPLWLHDMSSMRPVGRVLRGYRVGSRQDQAVVRPMPLVDTAINAVARIEVDATYASRFLTRYAGMTMTLGEFVSLMYSIPAPTDGPSRSAQTIGDLAGKPGKPIYY